MSSIAVIGAGAWGTALATHGIRAGHRVALVARNETAALTMKVNRESRRLPGRRLSAELDVRADLPDSVDLLLWVVPTQHVRASLSRLRPPVGASMVVCSKGVESGTHLLPLEVVADASPVRSLAILTGPNFAHEVAQGLPAAAVVASNDADLRERVRAMLGTPNFRLYSNDDPLGAQLGGAAKNVIAI